MKLIRCFPIDDRFDIWEVWSLARGVFLGRGFRNNGGHQPAFSRGSHISTMMAFNPAQWRMQATLRICHNAHPRDQILELAIEISSFGQIMTPRERDYFVSLTEEIERDLKLLLSGPKHASSQAMVLQPGPAGGGALMTTTVPDSTMAAASATVQNITMFGASLMSWIAFTIVIGTLLPVVPMWLSALASSVPAMVIAFAVASRR